MIQVVTIDGPAGAGKSSVARGLADRLGWRLLDTGAMYRAVALAATRRQVDLHSESALTLLVESVEVVVRDQQVWLDGEVVTDAIRTSEVTELTRFVADSPAVRRRLVACQHAFATSEQRIVAEGRDQGTIVFPDALRKYFLIAEDTERARRRQAELADRGETVSLEDTLRRVRDRDEADMARTIAPMIAAVDARIVDSTGLELDQVVTILEGDVRAHLRTSG